MSNKKTLKEITENTMKRLRTAEIVMPSDYTDFFKEELDSKGLTFTDLDILLEEEMKNDINRSMNIIQETEKLLSDTGKIISKSSTAIKNEDAKSLEQAKEEINKLLLKVSEMSKEVYNDELTGAYNRKWLFREYLVEEKFAKTNGIIAFIDMNKLKIINDTYGHKVGDKAIKFFVKFINENLKPAIIIRFAGDEFLALFEENKSKEVKTILLNANNKLSGIKLRTILNNTEFFLNLSFSFGFAEYKKEEDIVKAIDKADHDMYEMKKERGKTDYSI